MKRSNKAKAQSRNQSANKFTENVPITIYPCKKIVKPVPEVEKGLMPDEEYAAGFAENKKRVARTPPETLKKAVRNLNEDLNDSKKLKDIKVNPQGESKEEMDRRQIAEVKDYMDLEDHGMTGESANVTKESPTRTGKEDDGTTSSSSNGDSASDGDSSSDGDPSSEEDSITDEQYEEIAGIQKQFEEMVETKSPNEALGVDLIKKLLQLPISLDILRKYQIARAINNFRKICRTDEIISLGDELMKNWEKLFPEDMVREVNRKIEEESIAAISEMEVNVENQKDTESYVFVKGEQLDITQINSFGIYSAICELLNRKPDIIKINQSLRILCRSKSEKKLLMETRFLAGHRVIFSEPYVRARNPLNELNRGIIFIVEEDVPVEQITHELGIPATRIIRKVRGESIVTKQVILYFNGAIPEIIYFGWRRYRVSLYIPDPIRCFHCQKFGHKAHQCRSAVKCPICSGRHLFADCDAQRNDENKRKAVCPNCKGDHPASYRGCKMYQEAKSIKQIQVSKSLSYADAVKTFREQTETSSVQPEPARQITVAEVTSHNIKDISSQDQITVSLSSSLPNEGITNSIISAARNTDLAEVLINFVQSISALLNGNKPKDELIADLHRMVENLAKSIK